jgi:hypothetical protein
VGESLRIGDLNTFKTRVTPKNIGATGFFDVLNPKMDLFDGLDTYINARFHKIDAKGTLEDSFDSDEKDKGMKNDDQSRTKVFSRLSTMGLNNPRKSII